MADWSVENMNPYMTPNGKLLDISWSPFVFQKIQDEFKDNKGVVRIRIWKKNRQHNSQMKGYKSTNTDLQNKLLILIRFLWYNPKLGKQRYISKSEKKAL
jgi:hypothetical protein